MVDSRKPGCTQAIGQREAENSKQTHPLDGVLGR